jgi:hypothetical protein
VNQKSDSPLSNIESENRPYEPSWIDYLIGWIKRLPGPSWVAYLLLFLVLCPVNLSAFWLDGSLQVGTFDIARIAEVPLLLYFLPLMHYLNNVAGSALSEFLPILSLAEDQISSLNYQLTTLPRRLGRLSLVFGLLFGVMSVAASPGSWELSDSSSTFMILYRCLIAVAILILAATFFLHTVHQLRMVSRLQRMVSEISLFQTRPVYALSSLTARTGIGIAILIYYYAFLTYGIDVFGARPPISLIDLFSFGLLLLTSIGSFIIPLLGMHDRLVAEKGRALFEANKRIESVIARLHERVDTGLETGTDIINQDLASLLLESETLSKKSTWPWKPETLRGFLGAITLPVLVWLITTALDRILPG